MGGPAQRQGLPVQVREGFLKAEPMTSHEETYAAIRKAIALLDDPFTRLVPPRQYQALKRSTAGRPVVGVGLEVGFRSADDANSEIVVSCVQTSDRVDAGRQGNTRGGRYATGPAATTACLLAHLGGSRAAEACRCR